MAQPRANHRYRLSGDPGDFTLFRKAASRAKRCFYDERIRQIAVDNRRPWDLMSWTMPRDLPTFEAIKYKDQPCNTLDQLWDGLHSTFNSASGRDVDLRVLEELPQEEVRPWVPFSMAEL